MGKGIAYLVAMIAGVIVVGWVAVALLHALLGGLSYLIVGAVVIGGGFYLYGKAKKGLAPGTRTQRRIEAAQKTYRMRNR
jgi:F0F1-type ATP synthase assembly protein I